MYIYPLVCKVCIDTQIYAFILTYLYTYINIYVCLNIYIYIYIYILSIHICINICEYESINLCIYACDCVHVDIYTYVYIYMYSNFLISTIDSIFIRFFFFSCLFESTLLNYANPWQNWTFQCFAIVG